MPKLQDVLKSGALGVGAAALARDPDMLKNFGVLGNAAARSFEDEEKAKLQAAQSGVPMKKGGVARGWGKARGARKAQVY
jgi:hypothetical protein